MIYRRRIMPPETVPTAQMEPWQQTLCLCDDMLEDDRYEFAHRTIGGIRNWVARHAHVTERQIAALENIYNSKE